MQWRLSLVLSVAVLAVGLLSTAVTTVFTFLEAKEYQDEMLRQIAWLASGSKRNQAPWEPAGRPAALALADGDARIQVIFLPDEPRPEWLPEHLVSSLFTCPSPEGEVRVFMQVDMAGKTIVVYQPTESRDERAWQNVLHSIIPTLLLLPILTTIVWIVVRHEFKPVRKLARVVDMQPADKPVSLPREEVPTELEPFVRALNRLLERMQNLLTQQRRFVADAAHELRTPLTAFTLQVQNLGNATTKEEITQRLAFLQEGLDRTRRLTEQLLNLARVQGSGGVQQPVDISLLTRQLMAEYFPLAEAKEINLGLEEEDHLMLPGSFENLYLIVKNGLDNALKYTQPGGTVTIRLARSDGMAILEVRDNGPGLGDTDKRQAFSPFYRSARLSDKSHGSGLGLAIAHEASIALGGSLSLHDPAEGSGLIYRYIQLG